MPLLYHLVLSPACRAVRIVLHEKRLDCDMISEPVWRRRREFLALNPAGTVPVLVMDEQTVLSDARSICEYLDEAHPEPGLLLGTPADRAETRRLTAWFHDKFEDEVSKLVVDEKVMKRFLGLGQPDGVAIRAGLKNLGTHLDYVGHLCERRRWLAGETFSLADIFAAAQISCLDYLGDIHWDKYPGAHDWYARVKSRPSMRSLLMDRVAGLPVSPHYHDLDF